jgi:hypothetical protein
MAVPPTFQEKRKRLVMAWKYMQGGLAVLGLVLAAGILVAWRAARKEQAQLQVELNETPIRR